MAASLVGSAAPGAGLEIVFANFLKLIVEVGRSNALFRKTLEELKNLLESVKPSIHKIEEFNEVLDRPQEIKRLTDLIKKGENLVIKCSKIHRYNYFKKPFYRKKLIELEQSIHKYISGVLPLYNSSLEKEALFRVKQLSLQVTNLSLQVGNLSIGASSGGSFNKGGFLGICSPPGLKVKPVGLEVPLTDLKEKLLKDDQVSQLIVVSAPGGCGKSTLAVAICHDADINDKYKGNIFFVIVSKSPNVRGIVQRLFQHKNHTLPDFVSEEDAVNQLENLLKRIGPDPILLVLDDVWSRAESLVEKFKFPIPGYNILMMSRFEFPRFGSSYKLQTLSDADAMTLFCHQAFPPDGNSYRPEQDVVDKIVKVCKGFPLAISVVGKSLCGRSGAEWSKRIKECSKAASIMANSDFELRNCLQSSVDALDDNAAAKECFKDLGSFPEDQKTPATTLIDMWVEQHKLDEDNAIANLYELSDRNLVDLVVTRKDANEDYGSINVLQHDLLRELAIIQSNTGSIEHRKRLFIDISGNKIPEWWVEQRQLFIRAKLLSICTDELFSSSWYSMEAPEVEVLVLNFQTKNYTLPSFMRGMDKLKVLIIANNGFFPAELSNFQLVGSLFNLKRIRLEKVSIPSFFLNSLQLEKLKKISLVMCNIGQAFSNSVIRMPNLVEINIDYCNDLEELPDGFCDLYELRKLRITNCHKLFVLPEDIGKLVNLELLRLDSCIELLELPETIGGLHNLRILDISDCLRITKLPERIGELHSLRKLYMIECSSCELPSSVMNLVDLKEVISDEETANSWKEYEPFLPNLEIKVHKDINLNWLQ